MTHRLSLTFAAAAVLAAAVSMPAGAQTASASPLLTPGTPIALPGGGGGFDYMTIDAKNHRLFASHPGAQGLAVMDMATNTPQEISLGAEVNGVAVDAADNKFFTAGGGQKVFALDRDTLKQLDVTPLDGPGDGILFDPDNDTLYVDNDESTRIWTVDGKTDKVTGSITIDGAPEYMVYDRGTKRLFQNIKPANEVQVIDTTTNKVVATWPTAPMTSPHGMVFDRRLNRIYSAGKNDMIAVMDATSGKVLATAPLASAVDQIAYDRKLHRIYCPGGGELTIVQLSDTGDVSGTSHIDIPKTAHTIAVDGKTHTVWICYYDKTADKSYFQPFTASGATTASAAQ